MCHPPVYGPELVREGENVFLTFNKLYSYRFFQGLTSHSLFLLIYGSLLGYNVIKRVFVERILVGITVLLLQYDEN